MNQNHITNSNIGKSAPLFDPGQLKGQFNAFLRAARSSGGEGLIELRIPGTGAGLFDDPDAVARASAPHSGRHQVYISLNPRKSASLNGRPFNQLLAVKPGEGFGKDAVESVHWLLIDLDHERLANTSANDQEIANAKAVFEQIGEYLTSKDIPYLPAFSGNGFHLLVMLVQMPATNETAGKIGLVLKYLNRKFGTDQVKVDEVVKDPARIVKAYGTLAIKGDNTPERPHRLAKWFRPQKPLLPIDLEKAFLSEIAEQIAFDKPKATRPKLVSKQWPGSKGDYSTLDIVGLFQAQGEYHSHVEGEKHDVKCPWEDQHTSASPGDTIIFEASGGSWPGFHCKHSHCDGRTISDVIQHFGPDVVDRYCEKKFTPIEKPTKFASKADTEMTKAWSTLLPLPKALPDAPRITSDLAKEMIPESLRVWVVDIAERLQVPIESVAVCAFACLSGVIGRKVSIRPKKNDDWQVLCILWMALVARPSQKKTPTISEVMKPLSILEAAAREEFKDKQAEGKAAQAVRKAKVDAIKDDMKTAAKSNGATEMGIAQRELAKLEKDESEQSVFERRFKTCDSTVEKLGELLNQNPNGLIYKRDELCGWLRSFDRPGREGDREFFLEAWNGKDSFDVDRIGRGSLHVKALCLTVMGGIQPGKLEAYVSEASKGSSGDDGLLQRFQLLVYPERSDEEPTYMDRKPDLEARESVNRLFKSIHELNPTDIGATAADEDIPGLRFDQDAQKLFEDWLLNLDRRLHSSKDLSPSYEAHLGKYRSLMPALALLFHLIDRLSGVTIANDISLQSARRAAMWCDFLEGHAKKVYAISIDKENHSAHALAKKIKNGNVTDGMKVRDLKRHHWSLLADGDSVDAALMVLEQCHWARVERIQTEGAPIPVVRLHPDLVKVSNEDV